MERLIAPRQALVAILKEKRLPTAHCTIIAGQPQFFGVINRYAYWRKHNFPKNKKFRLVVSRDDSIKHRMRAEVLSDEPLTLREQEQAEYLAKHIQKEIDEAAGQFQLYLTGKDDPEPVPVPDFTNIFRLAAALRDCKQQG